TDRTPGCRGRGPRAHRTASTRRGRGDGADHRPPARRAGRGRHRDHRRLRTGTGSGDRARGEGGTAMTRTETAAPAPEAAAGIAPQTRRSLGHWRTDPLIRALGMLALSPRRLLWSVLAGAATLGSALALSALSAWLITR